jgi:hypothetical protein
VVGWAEEEDALATPDLVGSQMFDGSLSSRIRPVDALVGPCSSWPGVGVSGVPAVMSLVSSLHGHLVAHGAMMARAFGVGIVMLPCCEDVVPMGVVELGTSSSQPSSCCESCLPLSVYQEPACEGLRVTMLCFEVVRRENRRLKGAMVTKCCCMKVSLYDDGSSWGVASTYWWGKSYLCRATYVEDPTLSHLELQANQALFESAPIQHKRDLMAVDAFLPAASIKHGSVSPASCIFAIIHRSLATQYLIGSYKAISLVLQCQSELPWSVLNALQVGGLAMLAWAHGTSPDLRGLHHGQGTSYSMSSMRWKSKSAFLQLENLMQVQYKGGRLELFPLKMCRQSCPVGVVNGKISPSSRSRKSDTRRDCTSQPAIRIITHFHPVASHLTISSLHHFPTLPFHTICVAHSRSTTFITQIDIMCSKRKRSVDDSPLSSYGAFSTPEAQSPIPFPQTFHGSMDVDVDTGSRPSGWDFASVGRVKSSDWGHRTRKRVRDNRPDERSIHRMFPA